MAPFIGARLFADLWGVEPLAYLGATLIIFGLIAVSSSYIISSLFGKKDNPTDSEPQTEQQTAELWGKLTRQYFDLFNHDMGRPLRRILGKERELRTLLQTSEAPALPADKELLDEIEGQAPNFRLMMSNIQVLVQLEAPETAPTLQPVEPSEMIRRIVDRYSFVTTDQGKEITWWAEPAEFGLVYCDSAAIEHIVTNLVDNTVRFATEHIEIKLSKNLSHFFIRVWDDGPGIADHYIRHIFDRGWTPHMARREEKTSSGLGLYIARTLAKRYGGEVTVDSVTEPDEDHHTAFLLSLPLQEPEAEPA